MARIMTYFFINLLTYASNLFPVSKWKQRSTANVRWGSHVKKKDYIRCFARGAFYTLI